MDLDDAVRARGLLGERGAGQGTSGTGCQPLCFHSAEASEGWIHPRLGNFGSHGLEGQGLRGAPVSAQDREATSCSISPEMAFQTSRLLQTAAPCTGLASFPQGLSTPP